MTFKDIREYRKIFDNNKYEQNYLSGYFWILDKGPGAAYSWWYSACKIIDDDKTLSYWLLGVLDACGDNNLIVHSDMLKAYLRLRDD